MMISLVGSFNPIEKISTNIEKIFPGRAVFQPNKEV